MLDLVSFFAFSLKGASSMAFILAGSYSKMIPSIPITSMAIVLKNLVSYLRKSESLGH